MHFNIVYSAIFFPGSVPYLRLKHFGVEFRNIEYHSLLDIRIPRPDALLNLFIVFF